MLFDKTRRLLAVCLALSFAVLGFAACGAPSANDDADAGLELTLEELSAYNGKDGQPAYIAVDGVIYDVTNAPRWSNGEHNGFSAGQDLTEEIKTRSPHGTSKLSSVPAVGKLIP